MLAITPPMTRMTLPVVQEARSLARKATVSAFARRRTPQRDRAGAFRAHRLD